VGALRLRRPRGPGGGSPEPRLRDWPALGKPRRRLAQRTHVQWPRLTGRFYRTAEGPHESQGWCAVCGARHTTPTSGPASRPASRAQRAISSRCPVGPGKRPREGRGGGGGGASAAHGRPPPRGCGDGARVRLPRDHPHVVLRRDPHVVLRCSPEVVLRCDPHVVLRCSPHVVLRCDPRAVLGCDPHVVLGCDPHVVLRRGPCVVVRSGRCSASPGWRPCSRIFMRLLQTCRARSRLGQCASLSPTRT
jgi:hypothetical protein